MPGLFGADDFTEEELRELFADESQQETPPANDKETNSTESQSDNKPEEKKEVEIDTTKAFAKRLKESTEKARNEERESIAKSLGYESYDAMISERQKKLLEEKGLDPEEVSPIVDKLVKEKLDNDPRMQELAELRKKQIAEFGKKELSELTQLTGGEIKRLEDVPKDVIELWKTKGSLKAAYIELHGEELIIKARSEQNKGSTGHLNMPTGSSPNNTAYRPLTKEERDNYKFFNPGMTDEELDKITVKR